MIKETAALPQIEDRALEHDRVANQDWDTNLHTRDFFFDILEWELRRIRRSRNDASICLVDIDNLRAINELYGHAAGDEVLKQLADIVLHCVRETDIAARVGGEEFGVFLPDTPFEGALEVAERIRKEVAAREFVLHDAQSLRLTVSVGVAAADYEELLNDAATLYRIAETRLYIAKHSGRNQVSQDAILNLH